MTDDDELMSELRRIADELDPVPELVIDNGRRAFLTRGLDAELAELLLDTAVESAQVRGDHEQVRLLSFQLDEVSLEVQVEYADDGVSLRGLVLGASGTVGLESTEAHRAVPIDAAGGFTTQVSRGAARFQLNPPGRSITTQWVLL